MKQHKTIMDENHIREFEEKYRHLKDSDPFSREDEFFGRFAITARDKAVKQVKRYRFKQAKSLSLAGIGLGIIAFVAVLVWDNKAPESVMEEVSGQAQTEEIDLASIDESIIMEVLEEMEEAEGEEFQSVPEIRPAFDKAIPNRVILDPDSLAEALTLDEIMDYLMQHGLPESSLNP